MSAAPVSTQAAPSSPAFRGRNGQWVKFDMPEGDMQVVVTNGATFKVVTFEDPAEAEIAKKRFQTAKDGRCVGIYIPAARAPTGKNDAAGNPTYVHLPACVAPQRQILGPSGEQNLDFAHGGKLHVLLLKADSLRHLEASLMREDIPKHRDATCNPNWNPRP